MPVLLFSLRGVPEDEATDVREILEEHAIEYYETSAGNWGISTPAIWLQNSDHEAQARSLIAVYQQQRYQSQREIYLQQKANKEQLSFLQNLWHNPLQSALYIVVCCLVFYISIKWVLDLLDLGAP